MCPWYQSQRSSTLVKYKCFQNLQTWLPTWPLIHDSFTKASLLQLFTCPGKVSCEGGSTGLQATKKRESYASIEPHKNDELEHLDIFCDVQDFSVKFISSYHLSPHLIMSDVLRTKSSLFNQARWNQCVPPQNRPAPQLVVGSTEQYIGHCTSPVKNCKWNETISKKKSSVKSKQKKERVYLKGAPHFGTFPRCKHCLWNWLHHSMAWPRILAGRHRLATKHPPAVAVGAINPQRW